VEFLIWIEESTLGVWIRESMWGYPIVLSGHAVGMATVIGIVTMLNLRILGYARVVPFASLDRLVSVAWGGFILNLVTGLCLFTGDAQRFFFQFVFQVKIALIIAGGISVWLLMKAIKNDTESGKVRVTAVFSLLFWFGAIVAGRLTAYIGLD